MVAGDSGLVGHRVLQHVEEDTGQGHESAIVLQLLRVELLARGRLWKQRHACQRIALRFSRVCNIGSSVVQNFAPCARKTFFL